MRTPAYEHAQYVWPLWIIMGLVGGGLLLLGLIGKHPDPEAPVILLVSAVGLPLASLLFLGRMVVALDGKQLEWRFGFLGLPRWRISMADIESAEAARTTWLEGWGIHRTKQGWLYNAAGFDAVRITLRDGRSLRLGSDEPRQLLAYIEARLPRRPR